MNHRLLFMGDLEHFDAALGLWASCITSSPKDR
jgi:hypothetical protein